MKFRTAYQQTTRSHPRQTDEQKTEQAFKDECKTVNIVKRYLKTGVVDHLNTRQPLEGTFDEIDFHTAMNIVAAGKSSFEAMPAKLREQFDNNPEKFVEFVQNPENEGKLVELGLANAPKSVPETKTTTNDHPNSGEAVKATDGGTEA